MGAKSSVRTNGFLDFSNRPVKVSPSAANRFGSGDNAVKLSKRDGILPAARTNTRCWPGSGGVSSVQISTLGKTLASFPITADTPLDYRDGDPGSLYFATRHKRTASGSSRVHIGFERIFDAADVFAKARAIQRGVVK